MNEFIKMDVFFFIASIATILLVLLMIIVLIYVIKILRDLKYISAKVKTESDKITEDIESFRQTVRHEGFKVKNALSFVSSIFKKQKKGK